MKHLVDMRLDNNLIQMSNFSHHRFRSLGSLEKLQLDNNKLEKVPEVSKNVELVSKQHEHYLIRELIYCENRND